LRCSVNVMGDAGSSKERAKDIVRKGIDAQGGVEKLKKLQRVIIRGKGTEVLDNKEYNSSVETHIQFPHQFRVAVIIDMDGHKVDSSQVFIGNKGWESSVGQTRDLTREGIESMKHGMYVQYVETLLPLLKEERFALQEVEGQLLDKRETAGVKVSCKNEPDIVLFFDKTSGLLLKEQWEQTNFSGHRIKEEVFFQDYKDFHSLKHPSKYAVYVDGKKHHVTEITEMEFPDKIDDAVFSRPPGKKVD
jgi:hypothetical protein